MTSAPTDLRRWTELDGIRGILSIIVVLGHSATRTGISWFEGITEWFQMTMEIFFVISGFLIGRIVIKGLSKPGFLRQFVIRRSLRIWPLYYSVVAVGFAMATLRGVWSDAPIIDYLPSLTGSLKQLLFLQQIELWFGGERDNYVFGLFHSWSVAVEEQFYLLCPLLVLLVQKRSSAFLVAAFFLVVFCSAYLFKGLNGVAWWVLPARLEGFAGGLLIALLTLRRERAIAAGTRSPSDRGELIALMLGGILVTVAVFLCSTPDRAIVASWPGVLQAMFTGQVPVAAYFGMFLVAAVYYCQDYGGITILRWKPLTYLGEISYSTYLWHYLILSYLEIVFRGLHVGETLRFLISMPIIFGVAAASYVFIEQPFLRMKSRWQYAVT